MALNITTATGNIPIDGLYLADGTPLDAMYGTSASGNVLIWSKEDSGLDFGPKFEMIEILHDINGMKSLINSSSVPEGASSLYGNAMLRNSDNSFYVPDETQYPRNGTLILPGQAKAIVGEYDVLPNSGLCGVYELTDTSYKIFAFEFLENNKVNIYEGDESTLIMLTQSDVDYIPLSVDNWWIVEDPFSIFEIEYDTFDSFGDIAHTSGSSTFVNVGTDGFTWEMDTLEADNSRPVIGINISEPSIDGQNYEMRFTLNVISGTFKSMRVLFDGGAWNTNETIYSSGEVVIPLTADVAASNLVWYIDGSIDWSVEVSNFKFIKV